MKTLILTLIGTFAIAGAARAQEPKAHEHEHTQPPAVAEQKAGDMAAHMEMCRTMMAMMAGKDGAMMKMTPDAKDKKEDKKEEKK